MKITAAIIVVQEYAHFVGGFGRNEDSAPQRRCQWAQDLEIGSGGSAGRIRVAVLQNGVIMEVFQPQRWGYAFTRPALCQQGRSPEDELQLVDIFDFGQQFAKNCRWHRYATSVSRDCAFPDGHGHLGDELLILRDLVEAHEGVAEIQMDAAGWTVAVLRDD